VYQLVDFGNGRKLEQFAGQLIDRPCPAAEAATVSIEWSRSDGRFEIVEGHQGEWTFAEEQPKSWTLCTGFGRMQLAPTQFGHVGVFIEQQVNWQWLKHLRLSGLRILNLFAYTGGSTLAASASGASVTHVDSAKNIVRRASENARLSELDDRPIRWIVEDARKFVSREARRGNHYDGVIFDPPTYGHGTSAKTIWKIEEHLPGLLNGLRQIVPHCQLMLFTCHSPGYTRRHMSGLIKSLAPNSTDFERGPMTLDTEDGRQLECGNFVRWSDPSITTTTNTKATM